MYQKAVITLWGLSNKQYLVTLLVVSDHSAKMGTTPISYLIMSLPRPMFRGQTAVMTYNDVLDLFFQVFKLVLTDRILMLSMLGKHFSR